ncbi:ThuA domain-containing protein [Microbacterium tumbae]
MTTTLTEDAARTALAPIARRATVLLGGDDVYEDLFGVADALVLLLAEHRIPARVRVGTAALGENDADLTVLVTAVPELSAERVDALRADVRAGMGLLVLHASAVLFESGPERALAALAGARFVSHGPRPHESRFAVELDPAHPATAGLASFDVDHEHYLLELADDATPIAWRRTADGREPILAVRSEGAGRVCYLQLGHDPRPLAEPAVRALLGRCLGWLTTPMEG